MKKSYTQNIIKRFVAIIMVLGMTVPDAYCVEAADGIFTGKGSDYEDIEHGKHGYSEQVWVEGKDAYGIINVLEIVPDERMGFLGYTIGGCEPLGDSAEEKAWIMDGMANNSAGSESNAWHNPYYKDKFSAVSTSSDVPAMTYEFGYYTGYFKKVSPNCGVYAMGNVTYDGERVSNVVMVSKFANNAESNDGKYDYVWIESPKDEDGNYTQKNLYTTESQLKAGEPIYVYDYKKTKYLNNEEFLTIIYPAKVESGENTYTADGTNGAYSTDSNTEMTSVNTNNLKAAELFKVATNSNGNKGIKIFTRTPSQLQLDENKSLIDNVDLIVMANSGDGTYEAALAAYKKRYEGTGLKTDDQLNIGTNNRGKYDAGNDLSFEQLMKIYKRVVVDENLAIACSHTCGSRGNLETNISKLMFMLYYVNSKDEDSEGTGGSGRKMFMDFMDSYKDKAPVIARARDGVNSTNGFTDLKASDFVRIDETTGEFVVNNKYNGWYYEKVSGIDGPDNIIWRFRDGDIKKTTNWPSEVADYWLLCYTNGGIPRKYDWGWGEEYYSKQKQFPLFKYYMYVNNPYYHGDDNLDGKYVVRDNPLWTTGPYARYMNQLIFQDTYTLFRVGNNGGAFQLQSIIKDTPKKKPPEPAGHYESITKTAFMTMNIVNGDSVNTDIGGNKIMYVNDYEVDTERGGRLTSIPFNFEIRTTHPLDKMELYVDGVDDPIAEYSFNTTKTDPLGNSAPASLGYTIITGGSGSGSLTKAADESGNTPPGPKNPDTLEGVDDKIWRYTGTINELTKSYFETTRNATVKFKVYSTFTLSEVEGSLNAVDTITIVKREFFPLK